MVGPREETVTTTVEELTRSLAHVCKEEKILELEADGVTGCQAFRIRLKMSELALKTPPVPLSNSPRSSNSPAESDANHEKRRFGSGSP
jgi:hypothetical protein